MPTIKAGVAAVYDPKNKLRIDHYRALFAFDEGGCSWSIQKFTTYSAAQEYAENFVADYENVLKAAKDVQP